MNDASTSLAGGLRHAPLEASGLVQRVSDPADRRGNYIQLTPAGHSALITATKAHLPALQLHLVAPLADALRVLRDSLLGDPAKWLSG